MRTPFRFLVLCLATLICPPAIAGAADEVERAPTNETATDEALAPAGEDSSVVGEPDDVPPMAFPADQTPLLQDARAQEAWVRCVRYAQDGDERVRACLEALQREHPDTPFAWRAQGALAVLTSPTQRLSKSSGWQIPPGRLELSSVAGLFGIWSGIAIGVSVTAHGFSEGLDTAILGTGALAIGLGTGLGFGGYHLAESLDLGEGDSRWVASSLVWGTTLGIAAVPPILQNNLQGGAEVSLPLMTIVGGGLLGGTLALTTTQFHRFNSAEVSLINTGGWVGALFGLLTLPSLDAWNVNGTIYGSLAYISATSLGLTTGYLFSQVLDMSWGETLLLDLGAVLGLVSGGTVVFTLTAAGALEALPGEIAVPLVCAGLGVSTLSGLALTGLAIAMSRGGERPVWKMSGWELRPTLGVSHVVLDVARKPVWIVSGPTLVF